MNQRTIAVRDDYSSLITHHSSLLVSFPFAAIVGREQAKQALLMLAVEPRLKGVLIAAGPGTAKSTLARAFAFMTVSHDQRAPYVELPLGITEDRLLGGLDLEQTLKTGVRQSQTGLMAAAHGGVLYVDEINLLPTDIAHHLSGALNDGVVRLEREGLSETHPADFLLIGTYDPAEGTVAASLVDRVGLFVAESALSSPAARAEIVRRADDYARHPMAFAEDYADATAKLRSLIASARDRLPAVQITVEDRRRLGFAALQLGVEGNRVDLFAVRATCASAALALRHRVEEEDLQTAVQLVLLPRAQAVSAPEPQSEDQTSLPLNNNQFELNAEVSSSPNPQPPAPDPQLIIPALDTRLPPGLLVAPRRAARRSAAGSRGETLSRRRGRYVSSVAGRPRDGRIAFDATLRTAAPLQTLRRDQRAGRAISIELADLRFKRFKHKAGTLFIFAVDGSGSMALNRMHQAKGALMRLLREAYLQRDQVALVSFRGHQAEVLLPPSQSIARAARALHALPTGGSTPLAAGLLAALGLARRARRASIRQTMLVLLTDGRANVGLKTGTASIASQQKIWEELETVGAALQREAVASLVIDTQSRFTSRGEGQALADLLGGRYFHLPHASAADVYETIAAAAKDAHG
jgi:magnesium chelatase subunit D